MTNKTFILLFVVCLAAATAFAQRQKQSNDKNLKTAREFYLALPAKYLHFEQCEKKTDSNCEKYRREYIEKHLEIEDNENGYLQINGENLDPDITIALFRRPDDSYLIGVSTGDTVSDECRFLIYKSGKWQDVSAKVVPDFDNKTKSYGLPRSGTIVEVVPRNAEDGFSNYGPKLYDLEWTGTKFIIKK